MKFTDGLNSYMERKHYNNADLSRLLKFSDSMVSQYLSGKSGMSLDKLAILLCDGMYLEEVFGNDVAEKIKKNLIGDAQDHKSDSVKIVIEGLQKIIDSVKLI
jgi:predicted transcriptional regulator